MINLETLQKNIENAQTKKVQINSIKPWKGNDRIITQSEILSLVKDIEPFGQISPVIVYIKDNEIRKGNRTWHALKHLKKKIIEVKFIDFGCIEIANAYGIVDNKSFESGKWNNELLYTTLTSERMKPYLELTGFSPDEIKDLDFSSNKKLKNTNTDKNVFTLTMKNIDNRIKFIIQLKKWLLSINMDGDIK
jgi:hypothetical protein